MSIPNGQEQSGQDLISTVISLTGLPEEMASQELQKILTENGQSVEDLTLDQLRTALLAYLETLDGDFSPDSSTSSSS